MKSIYLVLMVFMTAPAFSQSVDGTVNFKKNKELAAVMEVPYAYDVVTASLNDYLLKKGRSKETDARGFTTYRNTQPQNGDSTNADLYLKVERKDKQSSTISLMVPQPAEASSTTTNTVSTMRMEEAKVYLDGLVPVIESYDLELQIKDANESITKAESVYKTMLNDRDGLDKRKLNIEREIDNNKREILRLEAEADQQRQRLADLVRKRKS